MLWYFLALLGPWWRSCVSSPLAGNNHDLSQFYQRVIEIGPPPHTTSFVLDRSITSLLLSPLETLLSPVPPRPSSVAASGSDNLNFTPTTSRTLQSIISTPGTIEVTSTKTETVTILVPPPYPTHPSPSETHASATQWVSPPMMTDLSAFNVSTFAGGGQNLEIVTGIPANLSATLLAAEAVSTDVPSQFWDNSTSVLRLFYPADSINPAGKPVGGAEFYASPLNLKNATSVTLQYDIFFPIDFDWVLAGKLPGLYGGHVGCSGGNEALDCFSTRLMWRKGGWGELYLYAPKSKQTNSLCSDPQSVCDAAYGLSIGRGSFMYSTGLWTTVSQTVVLNTPGVQDGIFTLIVNGKYVIHRNDVFYRDVPPPVAQARLPPGPPHTNGGLLGGILLQENNTTPTMWMSNAIPEVNSTVMDIPYEIQRPASNNPESPDATRVPTEPPVGFIGLFFSTFFGGHEEQYATPRDQYVWFKDFAMSYK